MYLLLKSENWARKSKVKVKKNVGYGYHILPLIDAFRFSRCAYYGYSVCL